MRTRPFDPPPSFQLRYRSDFLAWLDLLRIQSWLLRLSRYLPLSWQRSGVSYRQHASWFLVSPLTAFAAKGRRVYIGRRSLVSNLRCLRLGVDHQFASRIRVSGTLPERPWHCTLGDRAESVVYGLQQLLWRTKQSFLSVVFLLLRYYTFIALGLLAWVAFWEGDNLESFVAAWYCCCRIW